jgi:UDP-galactopyranose mutase
MYDSIIVGCGFAGAVVARELAERGGQNVCIIEKRNHIGGNCYDLYDDEGILIHQYGPHIFHTSKKHVYDYLSRFTKWYDYKHEVVANIRGEYVPVPFNLNTLKMVYGEKKAAELREKLINTYGMESRVPILQLRENPDKEIQQVADYVYENIFLHYTLKQWGQKPEEIDPSVSARVPVLISEDNGYFQEPYQGMPLEGFTPLFEKLLDFPSIKVMLDTDATQLLRLEDGKIYFDGEEFTGQVIFTGLIDEFFSCCYGQLPYRSLNFVFEHHEKSDYQPKAVVNYTVSEDYTRITEFKKLTGQKKPEHTTIVKEYPIPYTGMNGEIPYYSIVNDDNMALYAKYTALLEGYPNFHLLGRLAEYKYYNIDAIVDEALKLADKLLG